MASWPLARNADEENEEGLHHEPRVEAELLPLDQVLAHRADREESADTAVRVEIRQEPMTPLEGLQNDAN